MDEAYKVMKREKEFVTALSMMYKEFDDNAGKFLDEIQMLKFIQAVMEKPGWRKNIHDPDVCSRWRAEASAQELRKELINYAMDELKLKARVWNSETGMEPSGVDLVWRSDTLIDASLHGRLMEAVASFEQKLTENDYHPGSDNQVLNLIHPSLFCLVYGKSTDYKGNAIMIPSDLKQVLDHENNITRSSYAHDPPESGIWSQKLQWLPAEFLVSSTGSTKIASYINSLPLDSGLYPIIADVFSKIVPLFNTVLTDLCQNSTYVRFIMPNEYYYWDNTELPKDIYRYVDEDDDSRAERIKNWKRRRVPDFLPIPSLDRTIHTLSKTDAVDIKGCRLQVIVKIGSIVLTPDNPEFKGESWHVEVSNICHCSLGRSLMLFGQGVKNEKIVATAIYYFDSDNVSEDMLMFRRGVELVRTLQFRVGGHTYHVAQNYNMIDQIDDYGAIKMFGIGADEPMVQDAGTVKTPSGRVLVFPNLYQHKVPPFSLTDKSKPGHRKMLVFFLVDPTQRITSTVHVPPQDIRWLSHHMSKLYKSSIPQELKDMIINQVGYTTTLEEAKDNRLKLMKERTQIEDVVTRDAFSRPYIPSEY